MIKSHSSYWKVWYNDEDKEIQYENNWKRWYFIKTRKGYVS